MAKKLSLLSAVAAVIAFAVPAFASAAGTGLTEEGALGTLIPTGKIVTFTNTGTAAITSSKSGNITCGSGSVMLEARLSTNSAETVLAEEGGKTTYTAICKSPTGNPVWKNLKVVKADTKGGEVGTISFSFQEELSPGGTVCSYTGTNDTFTYVTNNNKINISEQPLSVTPVACGTTAKLDIEFELFTQETTKKLLIM